MAKLDRGRWFLTIERRRSPGWDRMSGPAKTERVIVDVGNRPAGTVLFVQAVIRSQCGISIRIWSNEKGCDDQNPTSNRGSFTAFRMTPRKSSEARAGTRSRLIVGIPELWVALGRRKNDKAPEAGNREVSALGGREPLNTENVLQTCRRRAISLLIREGWTGRAQDQHGCRSRMRATMHCSRWNARRCFSMLRAVPG